MVIGWAAGWAAVRKTSPARLWNNYSFCDYIKSTNRRQKNYNATTIRMASEGVAMNTLQTRRAGMAGAAADGKVVRLTRDRRGKGADSADAEAIYRRILAAIIEHRLAPGRKLVEERLAAIFGASRAMIRQVLTRLSHEMVVTLIPNRGAFVAEPTVEEDRKSTRLNSSHHS